MQQTEKTIRTIYDRFNTRDIDGVLAYLTADVMWANGMDGGYVQGHDAIRDYWTHQWSHVSPHVDPVRVSLQPDGVAVVDVMQIVRDLAGNPIGDASHGLRDKTVTHVFTMQAGKVARFDIGA